MSKETLDKELDLLAAEYALGSLEGDSRRRAEARLQSDGAFEAEVGRWSASLGSLSESADALRLPDGLFEKIETAIDNLEAAPKNTVTLREDQGTWSPMAEGVECKELWQHEDNGCRTLLIRMAPGATYESHHHEGLEECYVVSGDLTFGSHLLRAGDFHVGLPGSDHPTALSREGCLLLISVAA